MIKVGYFKFLFIVTLFINTLLIPSLHSEQQALIYTEPTIFSIITKGYSRNTTVKAYVDESTNSLYIPIIEFINEMGFDIKWKDEFNAQGWFLNRDNKININLKLNNILVKNISVQIENNDIIYNDNIVYFSSKLIDKIFDLDTIFDTNLLEIQINSKNTLPIEIEGNKEQNRTQIANLNNQNTNSFGKTIKDSEKYYMNNSYFSIPSLDFFYSYGYYVDSNKDSRTNSSSSLTYGGIIAGLDSNISVIKNNQDKNTIPNVNMKFSRQFPFEKKYGVSTFAMGDIQSTDTNLISSNKSGRGFFVSSSESYQLNKNRTIKLEGVLLPGWEVELYQNDLLLDYKTNTINNKYEFNNVAVNVGKNVFTLVFYAPFGEVIREEKTFIIGASPVKSGEFGFEISSIQENRKVVEPHNNIEDSTIINNNSDFFNTNINLYYGVSENFTISTSLNMQEEEDTSEKHFFYNLGAFYSISDIIFESHIAFKENYNKPAYQASIYSNLFLGNIYTNYEIYNGIKSQKSYYNFLYAKDFLEIRYSYFIPFYKISLPLYIGYTKRNFEPSQYFATGYEEEIYTRTNFNFLSRYFLTLEDSIVRNENYTRNVIRSLLSTNYYYFGFRGDIEYEIYPYSELNKIGSTIDFRPFDSNLYTYIQYDRYFQNTLANNYIKAGVSKSTFIGNFDISIGTNLNQTYDILLNYGISLGYNPINKVIYKETEYTLANSGNLIAEIFIDENNNNQFDEGIDTPLKGAKLTVNNAPTSNMTNDKGAVYVSSLQTFEKLDIALSSESLEDIMLRPKIDGYNMLLRPGSSEKILFPLVRTGDLDGIVKSETEDSYAYSFITLISEDGKIVIKDQTNRDGEYIISGIPYGTYNIIIQDLYSKNPPVDGGNIVINSMNSSQINIIKNPIIPDVIPDV